MAKTKFFRVAVSGPTVDGRNIDPNHLIQAAKAYNPNTYAARMNLEHIRGITGDKPFLAYGDLLALKTEDVELDIGGKKEKRVGLFAQMDVSDELVALNKKGQKLYSSIEIVPNFATTGQAYCVGLAVTDTPASLGTERLQFSAFGSVSGDRTELTFELEDAPAPSPAQAEAVGAFAEMKKFFAGLTATPAPVSTPVTALPTAPVAPPAPAADQFAQVMTGMQAIATAVEASTKATNDQVTRLSAELETLKTTINATPAATYTPRPTASGGDGRVLAVC